MPKYLQQFYARMSQSKLGKYIGEIVYTFTQAMESNSKPPELSM